MVWPWVSRERYAEALEQVAELKAENRRLLDRVMTGAGQAPLYTTPDPVAVATPTVMPQPDTSQTQESPASIPAQRMTAVRLRAMAEKAARERKLGPVAATAVRRMPATRVEGAENG